MEAVRAAKIGIVSRIISSLPLLKITASLQFWSSCLNGKRIDKRMKHLNLLSYPSDVAVAPLQASEKQHLLPSSETWLASAVGSPALTDAHATIQTGEVLTALLRWERPSGKSKRRPLKQSVFGEGKSGLRLSGNRAGEGHKQSQWYF